MNDIQRRGLPVQQHRWGSGAGGTPHRPLGALPPSLAPSLASSNCPSLGAQFSHLYNGSPLCRSQSPFRSYPAPLPLPLPAWGVKTPALTSWGGQASSRGLTSPSPTRGWRQSPRCLSFPGQFCGYSVRPPISAFLGPDVRPAPGSPFGQRQQRWGRGGGVAGAWRLIFLYSPSPGPPERAWVQGPRGRSLGAAESTAPPGIGGN